MEKKTKRRGYCASIKEQLIEALKVKPLRDVSKEFNVPYNTLTGFCEREAIPYMNKNESITPYLDDVKRLAALGKNATEIADELGVNVCSLRYQLEINGVEVINGKFFKEDLEVESKVLELFNTGMGYVKIGEELNIPDKRIPKLLKKYGVSPRTISEHFQFKINQDAFLDVDDEVGMYFLGWVITDGCISDKNSIALSLSAKDKYIVEKFRDYLKPEGNVSVFDTFHNQTQKMVSTASFAVMSKSIADNLRKHNVTPRKSCSEKLPNFDYIHSKVAPIFWRAVVEGDGCVTRSLKCSTLSLVGSEELLKGFREFAEKICKVNPDKQITARKYGNEDFRLICYSGEDARNIMRILWSSGTIFLERKREIVETHLSKKWKNVGKIKDKHELHSNSTR